MRFSRVSKIILGAAVVAAGAYSGTELWSMRLDETLVRLRPPAQERSEEEKAIEAIIAEERAKEPFRGTLLGIEFQPYEEDETDYRALTAYCGTPYTEMLPWESAGIFNLQIDLPQNYVLDESDPGYGPIGCNGKLLSVNRVYNFHPPNHDRLPRIHISRSVAFSESLIDVSADRPKIEIVKGREVVVIEPLTDKGLEQHSYAFFPEPYGVTSIHAFNLSRAEFRNLLTIVASSTK